MAAFKLGILQQNLKRGNNNLPAGKAKFPLESMAVK